MRTRTGRSKMSFAPVHRYARRRRRIFKRESASLIIRASKPVPAMTANRSPLTTPTSRVRRDPWSPISTAAWMSRGMRGWRRAGSPCRPGRRRGSRGCPTGRPRTAAPCRPHPRRTRDPHRPSGRVSPGSAPACSSRPRTRGDRDTGGLQGIAELAQATAKRALGVGDDGDRRHERTCAGDRSCVLCGAFDRAAAEAHRTAKIVATRLPHPSRTLARTSVGWCMPRYTRDRPTATGK